jgi:hypothetical protein
LRRTQQRTRTIASLSNGDEDSPIWAGPLCACDQRVECGARRVVHDTYLRFVGASSLDRLDTEGYDGPPLPERYECLKGCARWLRAVGSLFEPDERTMWLHEPHVPIEMDDFQIAEWAQLIREAGLDDRESPPSRRS